MERDHKQAAVVAPLQQPAEVYCAHGPPGPHFGYLLRHLLCHRHAQSLPVPPMVLVARAGEPGVALPHNPRRAYGHRYHAIPLLFVKLWSVYPSLFRWPPVSLRHGAERLSVFLLVSSALVQLFTGFFNALNWYPWPWHFVAVHRYPGYVVIGSILLHIAVKLPDIKYGLSVKVADGDVLTESPWQDNPDAHSNAGQQAPPVTPALTRRGLLGATAAGVGIVLVTSVGQTLTPLEPIGLLAIRQGKKGPQRVPVNRTAVQARVTKTAISPTWELTVMGPTPYVLTLSEVEAMARYEAHLPITCVEGWSVGAQWRGIPLIDVVVRAGGDRRRGYIWSLWKQRARSTIATSRARRCPTRYSRPISTVNGSTSTTDIHCG